MYNILIVEFSTIRAWGSGTLQPLVAEMSVSNQLWKMTLVEKKCAHTFPLVSKDEEKANKQKTLKISPVFFFLFFFFISWLLGKFQLNTFMQTGCYFYDHYYYRVLFDHLSLLSVKRGMLCVTCLIFSFIDVKLWDGLIFPVMCQLSVVSVLCPLKGRSHLCPDKRALVTMTVREKKRESKRVGGKWRAGMTGSCELRWVLQWGGVRILRSRENCKIISLYLCAPKHGLQNKYQKSWNTNEQNEELKSN